MPRTGSLTILLSLLTALAAPCLAAEIHDAAAQGDLAKVKALLDGGG